MVNRILLAGRLCANPILRTSPMGHPVCNFTVACDRDYKSADGERETDFVDVVCWSGTAEHVAKYFRRGRTAIIDGRLQIRDWVDREGRKRRSVEIVADRVHFGDSKPKDQAEPAQAYSGGAAQERSHAGVQGPGRELPF